MDIKITYPDNQIMTFPVGVTAGSALAEWKKGIMTSVVAAKVNGAAVDLSYVLQNNTTLGLVDISSKDGLAVLRHKIGRAHV
jgi:threonyl-tRNA synthetase